MTARFPLYAKILGWFFVNLLLLAVVALVTVRGQFRFGLDALLAGRAGERVQAVADLLTAELRPLPRSDWNAVVERFSEAYRLEFHLFRGDGGHVAGPEVRLPPVVAERVRDRFPAAAARNRPGEFQPGAPRPGDFQSGTPRPGGRPMPQEFQPRPETMGIPPGPVLPGPSAKFMLHAGEPRRYWVGVRLPLVDRDGPRTGPLVLLVVSDTLLGRGLFFDFTPLLWVGAAVVLLSVVLWFPLLRGITRSLSQMAAATERIAEGQFEVRVPARRRDELGALAGAVNRMAGRLGGFVRGQKRFLGDIAHELCSPLARLQLSIGILEQRADPKMKETVSDLREEVEHMAELVNELLSFSKASLGASAIKLQPVAVREVIDRAVRRESAAEVTIRTEVAEGLSAQADPELLVRSLSNLIRNAVHHAGHAGPITVSAGREDGAVEIRVADCGPGVPEDALPKLFDPFYRVDESRTRETGGVGLGLTIVKTCIESCGGSVSCRNRQPSGLEVVLRLKAADER